MKQKIFITIICVFVNINLFSQTAESYFSQGKVYVLQEENYNKAIECFLHALELSPNSTEIYWALGSTYFLNGNYDKAIESYLQTIKLNPNYIDAYLALGDIYCLNNQKDYDKAIECYLKANNKIET